MREIRSQLTTNFASARHWRRFDKGSIRVSEGVLGDSERHPRPLLSSSYGP
jgi:hypothetical protein